MDLVHFLSFGLFPSASVAQWANADNIVTIDEAGAQRIGVPTWQQVTKSLLTPTFTPDFRLKGMNESDIVSFGVAPEAITTVHHSTDGSLHIIRGVVKAVVKATVTEMGVSYYTDVIAGDTTGYTVDVYGTQWTDETMGTMSADIVNVAKNGDTTNFLISNSSFVGGPQGPLRRGKAGDTWEGSPGIRVLGTGEYLSSGEIMIYVIG